MSDDDRSGESTGGLGRPSLLPYEAWTEAALRGVIALALRHAGNHGLPGDHHFYLTFRTDRPDVRIPDRVRASYPQEITIVLQHQFWDLDVTDTGFSVGLSFGGVPTTIAVPFEAVTGFADPAVGYSLRFGVLAPPQTADAEHSPPQPDAEQPQPDAPSEQPQVVSLDAFRRRTPPKE